MAREGARHIGRAGAPLHGEPANAVEHNLVVLQVVHLSRLVFGLSAVGSIDHLLVGTHLVGDGEHLPVQRDDVLHGLAAVVVQVAFIAEERHAVGVAHIVDGETVVVLDGAVILLRPQVADGELAQRVLALVLSDAEHTRVAAGLRQLYDGLAEVCLHHL